MGNVSFDVWSRFRPRGRILTLVDQIMTNSELVAQILTNSDTPGSKHETNAICALKLGCEPVMSEYRKQDIMWRFKRTSHEGGFYGTVYLA